MRLVTLATTAAVVLGLAGCVSTTGGHPAGQEQHPPTPTPTAVAPVPLALALSGGLKGHATTALSPQPIKTDAHYDYHLTDGTTQCVMPADDGAWTARMTFAAAGVNWELDLSNGNTFGSPTPGRHPLEDKSSTDGKTIGLWLGADKSPDGVVGTSGFAYGYTFAMDSDHNGRGTVTLDEGLTSGTIDAWIMPFEPGDALKFHLVGTWRCAA